MSAAFKGVFNAHICTVSRNISLEWDVVYLSITRLTNPLSDIIVTANQVTTNSLSRGDGQLTEPHSVLPPLGFETYQEAQLLRRESTLELGPYLAEEGDQVWVFQGASMQFLIRKLESGNYELLREAYIHGTMQGEVFTTGKMEVDDA